MSFNSTEAIKNYLYHSDHYALLSIHSISDDLMANKLKVLGIKDLSIGVFIVKKTYA